MEIVSQEPGTMTIRITRAEAITLNNALNEVCNGIHIDDWEFDTRMGVRRDKAQELLRAINDAVNVVD